MTGLIADITRASMHDGPGFRTVVFLKGCPLNCAWCHNPECISFAPQELYYADKCVGCGRCSEGCVTGARVLCGTPMTVETVMDVIRQEKPYYGELGGVTFTGGEPMAQKEFVTALADACRAEGIHTAIETSMLFYDEAVLSKMNLIMADLKIWDSGLHRRYTGVGNEVIKENLQKANDLKIPMLLRTPVIPEIPQQISEIAAFARGLQNVYRYELLPYHPLGDIKRLALNQELPTFTAPTKEMMKEWNQYAFLR